MGVSSAPTTWNRPARPDGEGLRARRRQTNLTTAIGKLGKEVLLPTLSALLVF